MCPFRVGGGHVVVDYAHNPAAFGAVAGLTRCWPDRRPTAVFTVPGDREDDPIVEAAWVVAGAFDRVVIKEGADRRGRRPGEVAALLERGAREAGAGECLTIADECEAVRAALGSMEDGEIVFVFYDDADAVHRVLGEFSAAPAAGLPVDAGAAVGAL